MDTGERRVREAIDSWVRPSEMTDDLAGLIAYTLRHVAGADGPSDEALMGAVTKFLPDQSERLGSLTTVRARREWFVEAAGCDRLNVWKAGLGARLVHERLLAAIFDERTTLSALKSVDRAIERWSAIDDTPAIVAAEIALALVRYASVDPCWRRWSG